MASKIECKGSLKVCISKVHTSDKGKNVPQTQLSAAAYVLPSSKAFALQTCFAKIVPMTTMDLQHNEIIRNCKMNVRYQYSEACGSLSVVW